MFTLNRPNMTFATLVASALLTTTLHAQDIDNRANVYGGITEYVFDSNWNQDNGPGWMLGGELPVGERWALTLEQYKLETDKAVGLGEADYTFYRYGGNYHLTPRGNWQPYLSAGLGTARQKNQTPAFTEDQKSFDFGLGVKHFFNDHLFMRGDAKAIRITDLGNWDYSVGLGLGYAFGPKSRPAPAAPAVVAELDSDGDGVVDSRDRCPNTPRDLAVDENGCPILDSSMVSQELLVEFDFDQAVVKPAYYSEIAEFAKFMTTYTNTNVVIEGHTDSTGTDEYNQGLSERRAQAIVSRLVSAHGIAASRLSAVGYGESRPLVNNNSAENRAKNRRIMAEVQAQVQEQRKR